MLVTATSTPTSDAFQTCSSNSAPSRRASLSGRTVSLVNAPGATDRTGKSVPALLEFRNMPDHPSHDRRVRKDHAALGHHRNQISVAQAIGDVPPHAQNNDLGIELAFYIDRITVLAFGHRASPLATQSSRRPLLHQNTNEPGNLAFRLDLLIALLRCGR